MLLIFIKNFKRNYSEMSDTSSAKQAAKRLYKKYNFQGGPLSSYEISSILKEAYQYLKIPFNPTQSDIKGYEKVLDADRDGKVTLQDLQTLAVQYLYGDPLQLFNKSTSYKSGTYVNLQSNNNYSQNKFSEVSQPFLQSSQSKTGYNYQLKSVGNPGSEYSSYKADSNYNFTQTQDNNYGLNQSWKVNQSVNKGGNDYGYNSQDTQKYSISQNDGHYKSYDDNQYQGQEYQGQEYQGQGGYQDHEYQRQQYQQSDYQNQDYQNQDYQSQEYQSQDYQNNNNQDRPYSDLVRQYLSVVGQVFLQYADKVAYTVTQDQVPGLLADTYAVLGRQGYEPTDDDVKAWMKLCDVNKDGKVQFQDYQFFVVKSLERSGLDLYD